MKVSDYIVRRVSEAGITDTFAVTGGGAMHLDDSFGHFPGMRCTYQHHEQACAMAAEAYARAENRPAAVLVTTGPGAVNAMTGVLCAWMESIPMLVISGQVRYPTTVRSTALPLRSMGIQEYDITASVTPMTKYAVMIERKEDVRFCLEKALHLMNSGRRGPVWLDIPLDVQSARIDPESLSTFEPADEYGAVPAVSDRAAEETLARLRGASRPVLFGGYGVRAAGAVREFRTLASLLGIPVLTGMSSVDLVPEDFPYYAGRTGMTGTRSGNFAMAGSDLFLSVGSRQSLLQTGFDYEEWARGAFVILNDLDRNELKKPNVRCDLAVPGDAGEFLKKLTAGALRLGASPEHPLCGKAGGWLGRCLERKKKYPAVTEAEKEPQKDGRVNLYRFYDLLSEQLPARKALIASCGTSRVAGTQAFRVRTGQRFITNSATASMGYDLPAAVGLCRGLTAGTGTGENRELPDPDVTLVTGDGSIMMNLQEMQTIATGHLPVRVFLICNDGYHSIRQTERAWFGGALVGVGPDSGDLGFPEPAKVADTFGFSYAAVRSNETAEEEMRQAMKLPLPALIEVRVTPLQNTEPKASSRMLADGTMVSVPLEDAAPFLSRGELRENLEIPLTDGERGI